MNHRVALLLMLAASLAACGRTPPPAQENAPSEPAVAASSAAPASAPSAPPETATGSAPAAAPVTDAADAPEGTTSLEQLAKLPPQHQLPGGRWKAGVNYTPVVPAQPTTVPQGKVEVLEIFWYGCPHCFELESYLQKWLQTKPGYVQLVRVPVMWGPVHRAHAQLYYTLQTLGRSDLDAKVFDTIHNQNNPLVGNSLAQTLSAQQQFAQAQGLDADAFNKAYGSFAVAAALQQAEEITQRYSVESVPLIIVNGKYATDVARAGASAPSSEAAHQDLIALINDLVAAEHHR